jgi:soluble P-type ATPase
MTPARVAYGIREELPCGVEQSNQPLDTSRQHAVGASGFLLKQCGWRIIVRMIEISIPRFGIVKPPSGKLLISRIVSDYTGTLSCGGKLTPGVAERLRKLEALVDIDVVSSDSFGTAHDELRVIPLEPHILRTNEHDEEKRLYVISHDPQTIAAFGNGRNDALMLQTVKEVGGLSVAVDNGEGCAVEALQSAQIFIIGITNALDLLLDTTRCKATLRT